MSSEEDYHASHSKKRKVQRACDRCRRRKIKCDGLESIDDRCSACIARNTECTYQGFHQKRDHSTSSVEELERRLARMEKLVKQLRANGNGETIPDSPTGEADDRARCARTSKAPEHQHATIPSNGILVVTPHPSGSSEGTESSSDEDDVNVEEIVDGMREMMVDINVYRYHGKSSGMVFLRSAVDLKHPEGSSREQQSNDRRRQEQSARPHPRLRSTVEEDSQIFTDLPPQDLLDSLVELYFRNVNDITPLLHEPTFREDVAQGLHYRRGAFGGIVLLVCANAARFTRDPRVSPQGPDHLQPAGWNWFEQVRNSRRVTIAPVQLSDLQINVLMALFMQCTHAPHAVWPFVGIGIRMAIDAGVHRRKMYGTSPTVEGELWKRAFWMLVYLEWLSAYGLGRPASIHDEDINLDLPTQVDDEYWMTPDGEPLFQQPPGKPSKVFFFVYAVQLGQILAFASRTIYSSHKSRARLGYGDSHWEERVVTDLDSALNQWMDLLPGDLRWDPDCKDSLRLMQTAGLISHYYHVQIACHRLFVSATRRDSPLALPSVVICTNAARSIIQILYVVYQRTGSPHCMNMGSLFVASVVLMMNVLGQKRSGMPHNASSDLELVQKVIQMLHAMKHELPVSEVFNNLLKDIVAVAKAPPEKPERVSGNETYKAPNQGPATYSQPNVLSQVPDSTMRTLLRPHIAASAPQAGSSTREYMTQGYDTSPPDPAAFSRPGLYTDMGLSPLILSASAGYQQVTHSQLQEHKVPHAPDETQVPSVHHGEVPHPPYEPLGLESLVYSEPRSVLPTTSPLDVPISSLAEGDPQYTSPGFNMGEFASTNETMNMWSNAPPAFGWDDWRAYFSNTGDVNINFGFADAGR